MVRHHLSLTHADNVVMSDRAVLLAAFVVGFDIEFAKILIMAIHERSFKMSTTYPFACLIFHLCRDAAVPTRHCDILRIPAGTFCMGLIKDEANVAAPWRGPRVEMHPLSENLANIVALDQGADPATSEPVDTTPANSSHGASEPSDYPSPHPHLQHCSF